MARRLFQSSVLISLPQWIRSLLLVGILTLPTVATAQDTFATDNGFQPHRDYLSPTPFEFFDTLNSNVILTFTDLELPGNAGRSLRLQRTYNHQLADDTREQWTFGLAGLPMRIQEQTPWVICGQSCTPIPDTLAAMWQFAPILEMSDGSNRRTVFVQTPGQNQSSHKWVVTPEFWYYDRETGRLYLPDGTVCLYDTAGRLVEVADPFRDDLGVQSVNRVTLTWDTGSLIIRQYLGTGQSRDVTLVMNDAIQLPTTMTYEGRTWIYDYDTTTTPRYVQLLTVTQPEGLIWRFDYGAAGVDAGRLEHLTTPQGAEIAYTYVEQQYLTGPDPIHDWKPLRVLDTRTTSGNLQAGGIWQVEYGLDAGGNVTESTIQMPSGTRATYLYGWTVAATPVMAGGFGLKTKWVRAGDGTELEREDRTYENLRVVERSPSFWWGVPQVKRRTITRQQGQPHTTDYTYNPGNADYHHPVGIVESGGRTTTRAYLHRSAPHLGPAPYIVGQLANEEVTVGADTVQQDWIYHLATGFLESHTVSGITTTFTKDAHGNVASVRKANNKTTTYVYSWGQVSATQTPFYTVNRSINPDGTVASETQAGRTTTYTYDNLRRLTTTTPPGGSNPTSVNYSGVTSVVTTRGPSVVTTTLDGFGRPIETVNAVGVRTRTEYDAEGRVTYQGYPFTGSADRGTTIAYDGLDRVTMRTNPDNTSTVITYGSTTRTLRDENDRVTVQTWTGFGHPDDARLTLLVDADGKDWDYTYNAAGQLTRITAPDEIARTWTYDTRHLLASETHPESGTTTYTLYDSAGVLKRKTDANGTLFVYDHDGNDRLTSITAGTHVTNNIIYESGSDNRLWMGSDSVSTTFTYDGAGRVTHRQDDVDAHTFNSEYRYNLNDAVIEITYPSGRKVEYEVDAEQRITRVFETAAGRDYAFGMTYHPSGALATYTAGNNVPTTIAYDPNRYWIQSITAGALQLAYSQYDNVGNVLTLGDSRPTMGQTFTYDALDRLARADGPYGTSLYAYNVHGNRQTAAIGSTYTYEPGTLRLSAQDGTPFTYDANGNLKTTATASFDYTVENWLSIATAGGDTTTYAYDADGWRAKKTATGDTTYYLRGLGGELLTEWHNLGSSARARDYVYAGSRLLSAVDRTIDLPNTCTGEGGGIPDGTPITLTIASGAVGQFTFEGSACRRVDAVIHTSTIGSCLSGRFEIRKPNGTLLVAANGICAGGAVSEHYAGGPKVLPVTGTYTVIVDPSGTASGQTTVSVYDVPDDFTGSITPGGAAVTVTTTAPTQNGTLTFTGTANQRIAWLLTDETFTVVNHCDLWARILKPDGGTLGGLSACIDSTPVFIDVMTLPVSGTYTIFLDPGGAATGSITATLYDVPPDVTGTLVVGGTAVDVIVTTPGQKGTLTFAGTQGQQVTVRITGNTMSTVTARVLKPDQSQLTSSTSSAASFNLSTQTVPVTGTYIVTIDPSQFNTGTLNVRVTSP